MYTYSYPKSLKSRFIINLNLWFVRIVGFSIDIINPLIHYKTMRLQWFKQVYKGNTYQEIASVDREENGKCYLSDGTVISSSRKCKRSEYPLLPSSGKLK